MEIALWRFKDADLPGFEAEPTRRIADGGCGGCRDQAEGIVIPHTLEQGGGRLDDQKPFPFQYSVRVAPLAALGVEDRILARRAGPKRPLENLHEKRCQTFFFSRKRPENVNGAGFLNQ